MKQSRLFRYFVMLLIVVLVVGSVTFIVSRAASPQAVSRKPLPPPQKKDLSAERGLHILVTNSEGKPLPATRIESGWHEAGDDVWVPENFLTDLEGRAVLHVPRDNCGYLHMYVKPQNEPSIFISRGNRQNLTLIDVPKEVTLKLPPGRSIGGKVVDQNGSPVRSVKVKIEARDRKPENPYPEFADRFVLFRETSVATDQKGNWELQGVPDEYDFLTVAYSHSNHKDLSNETTGRLRDEQYKLVDSNKLLHKMEKGLFLTGKVIDNEGNPVPEASIVVGTDVPSRGTVRRTNQNGEFKYPNVTPGQAILSVLSHGHAPYQQSIEILETNKPFEISLKPGTPFKVRVINEAGEPIPDARVVPFGWGTGKMVNYTLSTLFSNRQLSSGLTDLQGNFLWEHAPETSVEFRVRADGYLPGSAVWSPSEETQDFIVAKRKELRVKVVDAESGETIPEFKYQLGEVYDVQDGGFYTDWGRGRARSGQQGKFSYPARHQNELISFKVMSDGYSPYLSEVLKAGEFGSSSQEMTVKLEKAKKQGGIVKTPEGEPAAEATVVLYLPRTEIHIYDGKSPRSNKVPKIKTDAKGVFQLPPQLGSYGLFFLHDSGYANLLSEEFNPDSEIKLTPWSVVKGVAYERGKPLANRMVSMEIESVIQEHGLSFHVYHDEETDAEGRFEFKRVMASAHQPYELGYQNKIPYGRGGFLRRDSRLQQLKVEPNQQYEVKLGGKGRPLVGSVTVPEGIDLKPSFQYIRELPAADKAAKETLGGVFRFLAEAAGVSSNQKSETGEQFLHVYPFTLEENGKFRLEEIPPGNYSVDIQLIDKSGSVWGEPTAFAELQITVPEIEGDGFLEEPFDAGEIKAELIEYEIEYEDDLSSEEIIEQLNQE